MDSSGAMFPITSRFHYGRSHRFYGVSTELGFYIASQVLPNSCHLSQYHLPLSPFPLPESFCCSHSHTSKSTFSWAVVAHAFNPRTEETKDSCEFEANMVYRVSSRTLSLATEKPCLQKQANKNPQPPAKSIPSQGGPCTPILNPLCYLASLGLWIVI